MMARLFLVLALVLSGVAVDSAEAQSPFEFLRRQQKPKKPRQPPPAETAPAVPAAPDPNANESSVPAAPSAATATPAKPPTNTPPPPYEKDMRRVSEILGALHYLRPLCGADDGSVWRDKMQALLDAEGGPPDRRERLAGAFNEGYNGFQLTYRTCTPSADLAVRRYLAEGAKLTREIATRHGN